MTHNSCILIKMASGGLMLDVSTVPKIGPKIESMEFLASLGKFILELKITGMRCNCLFAFILCNFALIHLPKICWFSCHTARARLLFYEIERNASWIAEFFLSYKFFFERFLDLVVSNSRWLKQCSRKIWDLTWILFSKKVISLF